VVSVTDPSGRISRFSRQELLLFYQVAPQFVLTRLSAPRFQKTKSVKILFIVVTPTNSCIKWKVYPAKVLETCIWEIPGSNLGRDTNSPR
jgi:hypothetical protein